MTKETFLDFLINRPYITMPCILMGLQLGFGGSLLSIGFIYLLIIFIALGIFMVIDIKKKVK